MKFKSLILGLSCLLALTACESTNTIVGIKDYEDNKVESNKQFDFDGNYTPPELRIDGIKNEVEWESSSEVLTFGSQNQASMTIYRGEEALFCFFEVVDNDIQTVGFNNGDDVTHGDSVEVYFDFKNDAANKPQTDDIQLNIGAHGKTRIFVGANGEWGSWNGLLDYEIKLNGTLNDATDEDEGYCIELMVPYTQIGIDKNSVYGISVGHVARGKDSTHETLQYTWGGMVFDGTFIDPQVPRNYVVFMGNKFYSRGNTPIGNVTLRGTLLDENGAPVEGAKVEVGEVSSTTNSLGKYELLIDGNSATSVTVSKTGYMSNTVTINNSELRSESGVVDKTLCLISNNSSKQVTITGVVKNPVEGNVGNAVVKLGGNTVNTANDGKFSITCDIDYNLSLEVSKETYKSNEMTLDIVNLVKDETYDTGVVSLFSPASVTTFGGARGITKITAEIYRGFEGVHFLFSSSSNIINGDHIELFIDAHNSFYGRDTTDYRIDFRGDGTISIVNFGNGSNTVVSTSGIKNNAYMEGTTYYIDAMVPYSFLGVEADDIIGVSFGMWSESLKDWDGWTYAGAGFADYVAPEYSDQYCRIGLDNGLYRALSNSISVTKVYGQIVDANGNPLSNALVNGQTISADGTYSIYVDSSADLTLEVTCNGYISKSTVVTKEQFADGSVKLDFELSESRATISLL